MVKVDDFEGRGVEGKHKSKKTNYYKLICISILYLCSYLYLFIFLN